MSIIWKTAKHEEKSYRWIAGGDPTVVGEIYANGELAKESLIHPGAETTYLLARVNNEWFGQFRSGFYELHAEAALLENLRLNWQDMTNEGVVRAPSCLWPVNVLRIKLTKSPCIECGKKIIEWLEAMNTAQLSFLNPWGIDWKIRFRFKISSLYHGGKNSTDNQTTSKDTIRKMLERGIYIGVWKLASKLGRTEGRTGRIHEMARIPDNVFDNQFMRNSKLPDCKGTTTLLDALTKHETDLQEVITDALRRLEEPPPTGASISSGARLAAHPNSPYLLGYALTLVKRDLIELVATKLREWVSAFPLKFAHLDIEAQKQHFEEKLRPLLSLIEPDTPDARSELQEVPGQIVWRKRFLTRKGKTTTFETQSKEKTSGASTLLGSFTWIAGGSPLAEKVDNSVAEHAGRATFLVAKLNKTFIGQFQSGLMGAHAEEALLEVLRLHWSALVKEGVVQVPSQTHPRNLLTIRLSRSPCAEPSHNCGEKLLNFLNDMNSSMPNLNNPMGVNWHLQMKLKIGSLYTKNEERTKAVLGRLVAAGCLVLPWDQMSEAGNRRKRPQPKISPLVMIAPSNDKKSASRKRAREELTEVLITEYRRRNSRANRENPDNVYQSGAPSPTGLPTLKPSFDSEDCLVSKDFDWLGRQPTEKQTLLGFALVTVQQDIDARIDRYLRRCVDAFCYESCDMRPDEPAWENEIEKPFFRDHVASLKKSIEDFDPWPGKQRACSDAEFRRSEEDEEGEDEDSPYTNPLGIGTSARKRRKLEPDDPQ